MSKRCTNCGRFPFCSISMNNTACYEWIPREVEKED